MIAKARIAAYQILRAVSESRLDLSTAVAQGRLTLPDERDRALASEIATGVQRWLLPLDHLIAHVARRPVRKLDPEVRDLLRIGAYQLLYLSRVPASAVVDDAVAMTRRYGKGSASGLVNAALRALSRSRSTLPMPAAPEAGAAREAWIDYLSLTYSHPRWLVARWLERLGADTATAWMMFNNEPAPLTLRINQKSADVNELLQRLSANAVRVVRGRFAPDALLVEAGAAFRAADVPTDSYVLQDEASQLVARLAGHPPGRRVLDTCAAPGGKTTAIAGFDAQRMIVACDVRPRRMALLAETVRAAGAANVRLVQADATHSLPFAARFDTVIVDAPCSGLGTLRRDPDIKWRRDESELSGLAATQLAMLQHAADVVVAGGRLVYSTCSTEPEENEQIVDRFLALRPDYRARGAADGDDVLLPVVDARGHLRTTPDAHGLEGFFGAVFERLRQL